MLVTRRTHRSERFSLSAVVGCGRLPHPERPVRHLKWWGAQFVACPKAIKLGFCGSCAAAADGNNFQQTHIHMFESNNIPTLWQVFFGRLMIRPASALRNQLAR